MVGQWAREVTEKIIPTYKTRKIKVVRLPFWIHVSKQNGQGLSFIAALSMAALSHRTPTTSTDIPWQQQCSEQCQKKHTVLI